jgi:hypothetical protein
MAEQIRQRTWTATSKRYLRYSTPARPAVHQSPTWPTCCGGIGAHKRLCHHHNPFSESFSLSFFLSAVFWANIVEITGLVPPRRELVRPESLSQGWVAHSLRPENGEHNVHQHIGLAAS